MIPFTIYYVIMIWSRCLRTWLQEASGLGSRVLGDAPGGAPSTEMGGVCGLYRLPAVTDISILYCMFAEIAAPY